MSRLVTCLGLFRLLMKGIFGPYVLWPLNKKSIFWIVARVSARDYTVCGLSILEPVCCKKWQKKGQDQLLVCKIGDLRRTWMIQTDGIWVQVISLIIQDQLYTVQNPKSFPIPQTSNWSGSFFAVSYSKPALVKCTIWRFRPVQRCNFKKL